MTAFLSECGRILLLGFVPQSIHFCKRKLSNLTAQRGRLGFDEVKSFDESLRGLPQGVFRGHFEEAGEIHERKPHVAELRDDLRLSPCSGTGVSRSLVRYGGS